MEEVGVNPETSISDTILEFGRPVLDGLPRPAGLDVLKQALELVISVWNAFAMAAPEWGRPEHLAELERLISVSSSPHMISAFEALSEARRQRYAADVRVVRTWDVVIGEAGAARFDCAACSPS